MDMDLGSGIVVAEFKDLGELSTRHARSAHPPISCDDCGKRGRVAESECDRAYENDAVLLCADCGRRFELELSRLSDLDIASSSRSRSRSQS